MAIRRIAPGSLLVVVVVLVFILVRLPPFLLHVLLGVLDRLFRVLQRLIVQALLVVVGAGQQCLRPAEVVEGLVDVLGLGRQRNDARPARRRGGGFGGGIERRANGGERERTTQDNSADRSTVHTGRSFRVYECTDAIRRDRWGMERPDGRGDTLMTKT